MQGLIKNSTFVALFTTKPQLLTQTNKGMKSKFFIAMVAITTMLPTSHVKAAPTIVQLQVNFDDPENGQNPLKRTPMVMPEFYLDAHTLTGGSYTVGSTVVLKDEDGEVVFTSYIYVEGDTIALPSTLAGTYTIEVTRGSLTFVGEIEL